MLESLKAEAAVVEMEDASGALAIAALSTTPALS